MNNNAHLPVQSDINKVDQYTKLAEFYIARFDGRREFEWKVTLGLWGAILGSIAILGDTITQLPVWVLCIFAALVIFGHLLWLHYNWRANRIDKDQAFIISRKAAERLGIELPPWEQKTVLRMAPAMAFQLYITVVLLLLVVVYAVLTGG
jgi:hypothetical protein